MAEYDIDSLVRDPDFQRRSFAERKAILREADAEGFGTLPEPAQSRMLVDMKGQDWWQGGKAPAPQMTQEAALTAWGKRGKDQPTDTRKISYTGDSGAKESIKRGVKASMPYVRPVLEGGGAAIGSIAGAAAGAPTLVGAPIGGVAGAATGYASGKYLADALEGAPQSAPQTLADLGTGAMYEMGGQAVGPALGLAGKGVRTLADTRPVKAITTPIGKVKDAVSRNTPPVTEQGIRSKAAEIIKENTGQGAVYEKNAADAAKLNVPGYKPSLGEARNDPGLIKLQRNIERQPGTAGNIIMEQKGANQAAVKDYLENEFQGTESIDDVVTALNRRKAEIEATTGQAEAGAAAARSALNPADKQTIGRGVVEGIDEAATPAKKKVGELYENLPNDKLPTKNTAAAIKELKSGFRPGDEDVFPSRAIARVEEALQGPRPAMGGHGKPADPVILGADGRPLRAQVDPTKEQVGFQDLHSLRKDLGRQIQDASSGANPNRELAMKLKQIKAAVDADIEAGMGGGVAYREARDAFTEYAAKYRTGEVAKITQRGNQASGLNIPDAQIAQRVFSPDGADDFIRAVGKEKAATHADQYAAQDLLSKASPMTGEIPAKAVAAWLQKNMTVLRKYGISGKYGTVAKAQAMAEAARVQQAEFAKSAASKLLNSDVDKAIGSAFSSNPSNTGAVVDELLKQVGKDKQGVKGLQNAFKDFLVGKVETTAKTISGDAIISPAAIQKELVKYAPAMRRLYANDPGKIAALQKVSKAVEIQSRSAKSPIGGGSDTAENLNMSRSILGRVVDIIPGGGMVRGLARAGLGKINDMTAQEVNKVIARALYDPELAQTLVLASKRYKPQVVEKRFNSHLITMGLAAMTDEEK
jgi:hypothetical protein